MCRERQRRRRRNEGSASRVIFVFLGLVVTGVAIAGIAAVAWVINVANSAPSLSTKKPIELGATSRVYARRRQDPPGLHQRQRPAHAGALRRDPRRRPRGDRRHRGSPLLPAPGRGLRGHARGDQERPVQEGHPGRLDADHAARAQPLHRRARGRAWPATSARSARPSWPRSSRTAIRGVRKLWIVNGRQLGALRHGGGQTAVGIQAAARIFFDKPAARLTLREAALLAGLPQAPSNYNPFLTRALPPRGATTCCSAWPTRATSPRPPRTRRWR